MLDTIEKFESQVRGYVRAFPAVFDTADGAWLTASDGKRYLDFFAGAGTLNYGHNNPVAKQALLSYVQRDGIQHALDMATTAKIDFINAFQRLILQPRQLDYKLQFTGPTGTNAVEAAIKLARKSKQRTHIVAFTNAYHGHSLGSLSLTGNQYYHEQFYGSHNNVSHLPFDGYMGEYDTSRLLEKMLDDASSGLPKPAAVILETVQGEGGINVASAEWLRRVAQICAQRDILLIVDDIQVGNGRTGEYFSFENSGIRPDIVCVSKSLGGGLPMSLVLLKPEVDCWLPGQHTGTFRGNNLAFITAAALLNQYWQSNELSTTIHQHGRIIAQKLNGIAARYTQRGFVARGRGMVWGLDVKDGSLASRITRNCFSQGLVIETAGATDQVVKLLPPLTISETELLSGLNILNAAIDAAVSGGVDSQPRPLPLVACCTAAIMV